MNDRVKYANARLAKLEPEKLWLEKELNKRFSEYGKTELRKQLLSVKNSIARWKKIIAEQAS